MKTVTTNRVRCTLALFAITSVLGGGCNSLLGNEDGQAATGQAGGAAGSSVNSMGGSSGTSDGIGGRAAEQGGGGGTSPGAGGRAGANSVGLGGAPGTTGEGGAGHGGQNAGVGGKGGLGGHAGSAALGGSGGTAGSSAGSAGAGGGTAGNGQAGNGGTGGAPADCTMLKQQLDDALARAQSCDAFSVPKECSSQDYVAGTCCSVLVADKNSRATQQYLNALNAYNTGGCNNIKCNFRCSIYILCPTGQTPTPGCYSGYCGNQCFASTSSTQ